MDRWFLSSCIDGAENSVLLLGLLQGTGESLSCVHMRREEPVEGSPAERARSSKLLAVSKTPMKSLSLHVFEQPRIIRNSISEQITKLEIAVNGRYCTP